MTADDAAGDMVPADLDDEDDFDLEDDPAILDRLRSCEYERCGELFEPRSGSHRFCSKGHRKFQQRLLKSRDRKAAKSARSAARRRGPEVGDERRRAGQTVTYQPTHPLGAKSKTHWIDKRRFDLYEQIGAGPHTCHDCGRGDLHWQLPAALQELEPVTAMSTTDFDGPDELVPVCATCHRKARRAWQEERGLT